MAVLLAANRLSPAPGSVNWLGSTNFMGHFEGGSHRAQLRPGLLASLLTREGAL